LHRLLGLTGRGAEVQLAGGGLAFAAFCSWCGCCGLVAALRAVTAFTAFAAITVTAAALTGCAFLAAVRAGVLLAALVGAGVCAFNTFYALSTQVGRALVAKGGGAALGGWCFVAPLVAATTAFAAAIATCLTGLAGLTGLAWLALFAAGSRLRQVTA
jgi:hypothetical protein